MAFGSEADNLVSEDTNAVGDVFVRDWLLNTFISADVKLAVTKQPASLLIGEVGTYVFKITNKGPDNADAVTLTDIVSRGKVLSLTPSQGTCSAAAVSVCHLGTLAVGASKTVTATIKATGNPLIQKIAINAAPQDGIPSNNSVKVSTQVTR